MKLPSLLGVVVVLAGCGSAPPSPSSGASEALVLRQETAHFRILAGDVSAIVWTDVLQRLESNYARVMEDLSVVSLDQVTVRIWSNETVFRDELERVLGTRYAAAGYVMPNRELRVLAVPNVGINAVHEFCHVVTMAVQANVANNPRWLWESVALYENGELVDPRSWPFLANGPYPTLEQLNADPNSSLEIYRVGYTLAEFIVNRFGRGALLQLIRARGDVPGVLGVSLADFQSQWVAYVHAR